ncbi:MULTISPECIES: hypothetical protein [unclassified Mesorhizobium]|uniref:hypothetical protein n=1 Tax=unclassified Mesorhizobium TaxID=325217 RepID=UPI000FD20C5A|nr:MULTISPECIES: hypothetical protein [unclassified Mesorhizobium]TGP24994.1 hypothetical protein EN874_007720 [Mesorhizobium sp. M1D.F.Ca.ET.231.01.1.1]TGP36318.1 hypothetical protein EN877_07720 [Mesorhizobium sp. M1D.F.Ca.ET.234.01.1.1]TGS49821.1 hypothetical protein EN827_07720 [Mesorhizobium sp. M1D.F.Ca.ET.184.01.1.1]TGS64532.1 hypothetical protein EN826_007720 [Mesorhizobium sp. M1D.F.Ca.ET.183.01.1.1]
MDNVSAYLRSREFIERLTRTRLAARAATARGKSLTDDELAEGLGLPSEMAQMLFAFIEAWDLSEAAISQIAAHVAPLAGEAKH